MIDSWGNIAWSTDQINRGRACDELRRRSDDGLKVRRTAAEIAMQVGVGSSQLAKAVRAIDESLFLVFTDHDASEGQPVFAPQAMADLAAFLERTALRPTL